MGNDSRERNRLCGGLLGCGDDGGRQYMVEPDAVEAAPSVDIQNRPVVDT